VDGKPIYARDIPKYCTPEFYQALSLWGTFKIMGLPNGSIGWANEPADFVEMVLALEMEDSAINEEQRIQREAEAKAKQRNTKR